MTGFFKRDKTEAPESEAGGGAAEAEPTNYRAWSPADEEEAYMPAHGSPGNYAPPPLVMEKPQADAAELESIANAGSFEEQVIAALKKVYDPEIPVDIYELGLIYSVEVSARKDVSILMTLTSPGCPVAEQMPGMVQHAVHSFVEGVNDVEVEIVWDPPWTPDRMTEAAQLELGFI
jgi:FeS assembly SUF system protein